MHIKPPPKISARPLQTHLPNESTPFAKAAVHYKTHPPVLMIILKKMNPNRSQIEIPCHVIRWSALSATCALDGGEAPNIQAWKHSGNNFPIPWINAHITTTRSWNIITLSFLYFSDSFLIDSFLTCEKKWNTNATAAQTSTENQIGKQNLEMG